MFENRVLKGIFGPKGEREGHDKGENCVMRSFIICTPCQTALE
jgi:hypothetical protein